MANIYFDASLQCGDHCYVGLPFVLKCKEILFVFLCYILISLRKSHTFAFFFLKAKNEIDDLC